MLNIMCEPLLNISKYKNSIYEVNRENESFCKGFVRIVNSVKQIKRKIDVMRKSAHDISLFSLFIPILLLKTLSTPYFYKHTFTDSLKIFCISPALVHQHMTRRWEMIGVRSMEYGYDTVCPDLEYVTCGA